MLGIVVHPGNVQDRMALLVAMVEGAFAHAVVVAPHWLEAPWFLENLTGMATRYVSALGKQAWPAVASESTTSLP